MNNDDKERGENKEERDLGTCESAEPNPHDINLSFATTHSSVCPQSGRADKTHIGGANEAASLLSRALLAPKQSRFFIDSHNIKSIIIITESNNNIANVHLWFATDQITNYTTERRE